MQEIDYPRIRRKLFASWKSAFKGKFTTSLPGRLTFTSGAAFPISNRQEALGTRLGKFTAWLHVNSRDQLVRKAVKTKHDI